MTDNPFSNGNGGGRDFSSVAKPKKTENEFTTMFSSDDDTPKSNEKPQRPVTFAPLAGEDLILKMLAKSEADLRAKYPQGGIKAARILTAEILDAAPAGYFDKYFGTTFGAVQEIRNKMAAEDKAGMISDARRNPNDNQKVKDAYYMINSYASEYINSRGTYRGIEKAVLVNLVINEMLGFGIIEPLWQSDQIDEILCNGPHDIQVERHGELFKVPAARFRDTEHLASMLSSMFSPLGKQVALTSPLVKGRLYDNSRIFAVHQSLAPTGPNLAVRRHPEKFWTPVDMVNNGSANQEIMTFLGNLIYKGVSMVVVGGTSTGKALTLDSKIQTPQGSKTMGLIKVGDEVFDHLGNIVKVLDKFPQPARQVYAVTFSNGEVVHCDLEHNWYVSTPLSRLQNIHSEKSNNSQGWENLTQYSESTLLEIRDASYEANTVIDNYHDELEQRFGIRGVPAILQANIELRRNDDGHIYAHEMYSALLEYGSRFSHFAATTSEVPEYGVMTTAQLIEHGVSQTNNQGEIVHNFAIPKLSTPVAYGESKNDTARDNYQAGRDLAQNVDAEAITVTLAHSSIQARKSLLRGIVDVSGRIDTTKQAWVVEHASQKFLQSVASLASSLAHYVSQETGKVIIHTPENLSERADLIQEFETMQLSTDVDAISIVDISPVVGRVEEMACITVDSDAATYLTGNTFLTTHNTSLLNALSGFYKPKVRIMTLEDNLEMKPNPKKYLAAPMEIRVPDPTRPDDKGVSMRDLVFSAMQLRPDVIIVGEVTDHAAYDLVQALNTGHSGSSTIHANTSQDAIPRIASLVAQSGLMTVTGALDAIASAFDIIVNVRHFPVDGSRRIVSIDEVGATPKEIDGRLTLEVKPLFRFFEEGLDENNKITGTWRKVADMSPRRVESKFLNLERDLTWEELKELSSIPDEFKPKKKED